MRVLRCHLAKTVGYSLLEYKRKNFFMIASGQRPGELDPDYEADESGMKM
jgi:hypothetical protein